MKKTKKLAMSLLLVFCCVITLIAPSVVNAAADDFEIIDDTDARFVYSSGMQTTAAGDLQDQVTLQLQNTGATQKELH